MSYICNYYFIFYVSPGTVATSSIYICRNKCVFQCNRLKLVSLYKKNPRVLGCRQITELRFLKIYTGVIWWNIVCKHIDKKTVKIHNALAKTE